MLIWREVLLALLLQRYRVENFLILTINHFIYNIFVEL
jgi:hypothetical protein